MHCLENNNILYSGKFSHHANFCSFRGWPHYRENKNHESFNVGARAASPYGAPCRARAEVKKLCNFLLKRQVAFSRKFAPPKVSRYTVIK